MTEPFDATFDPTRSLLVRESAGATAGEVRWTDAALWPVLDRGDRPDLWLEATHLGDDHPDVRDEIAASFRRLETTGSADGSPAVATRWSRCSR